MKKNIKKVSNIKKKNKFTKDKIQSQDIKDIYGQASDHRGKYAVMPRISIMYDLENNFVLDSILTILPTQNPHKPPCCGTLY